MGPDLVEAENELYDVFDGLNRGMNIKGENCVYSFNGKVCQYR